MFKVLIKFVLIIIIIISVSMIVITIPITLIIIIIVIHIIIIISSIMNSIIRLGLRTRAANIIRLFIIYYTRII